MGQKFYDETEECGIRFTTKRKIGDVRIPNYVYDMWMPLIGSDAIGVYGVYCRLEREGTVKAITLANIAKACRIGKDKLSKINAILEACGFITISKPTGQDRLKHWTTAIDVLDPPQVIAPEIKDKYSIPSGYAILTPWLVREETDSSEDPNGSSERPKQVVDEDPNGSSKIESFDLQPLDVITPDGEKSKSLLEGRADSRDPVSQPAITAEQELDLFLGRGLAANGNDGLSQIKRSDWKRVQTDQFLTVALAGFLDATGWTLPESHEVRGYWLKEFEQHREYPAEWLPRLYKRACEKLREANYDIHSPKSLTRTVDSLWRRLEARLEEGVEPRYTYVVKRVDGK